MADPAYVDTHEVTVDAPATAVWEALTSYTSTIGATGRLAPLGVLLGTSPASGFGVVSTVPGSRIELAGRHRFSRYRLVFTITGSSPTRLAAETYADFPGLHGAAYRTLVIRSRLHVLATRGMLRVIARRAS